MGFLFWIAQRLIDVSEFFWGIYLETRDWVFPFYLISGWFFSASEAFLDLCRYVIGFAGWVEEVQALVQELGIWATIRELIKEWLPGVEGVIVWFENLADEVKLFFDNPVSYLRDKWQNDILPWAQENIPFFSTLYHWFLDFTSEMELFFDNPVNYLRDKWTYFVLPWVLENVPFFSTLYHWFLDFASEIELFFQNPIKYLFEIKDVDGLIHSMLMEWLPFYDDLVAIWQDIRDFFADPLEWVYNKLDEFFERFW